MAKENALLKRFLLEYTKLGSRLWRNNVGQAWTGKVTRINQPGKFDLSKGDLIIRDPRPFRSGLPKGTSDLIGLTQVKITPEMVDRTFAVFTAVEVKTKNVRATKEQLNYVRTINSLGGIGLIAREFKDVMKAVTDFVHRKGDNDETRH